jgi:RHS repeat-associated protein
VPTAGSLVTNADAHTTNAIFDWTLREPLKIITDPTGLALTTTDTYDPVSGELASETKPGGVGTANTPSTTYTVYYTIAANSTYPACGGHAEWANLVCRTYPGGQSASGPEVPATVTTYNLYNDPVSVTESNTAGVLRTTTYTYDTAGRELTKTVVGESGTGAAVPTQRNVYDPASGHLVHIQSVDGAGNITAQTTTAYDGLGRVTAYTDADGSQSTTTYDIMSRPATQSDGAQSRTISYDTDGENRGLPTKIVDGQAGTLSASYTADGRIAAETWSNGITTTYRYESGTLLGKTYTQNNCGQSDCTLDDETAYIGQGGTIVRVKGSFQISSYKYDAANRLTNTTSRIFGTCVNRVYGFGTGAAGNASDRTSLTTYGPAGDGSCQTTTAQSSATWTYDTADRITNSGYTYDSLGRTTTVPAADTESPGGGNLAATYDVNDLVRTLKQGTANAATYNLDVDNDRIRSWSDASGITHINHYSGTSDSPSWTDNGAQGPRRNIFGLSGFVGISSSASDISWQITDLRGNVVATVKNSDLGISATTTADEFGVPTNSSQIGVNRYGWLGSQQRAADNPDGIVLMGVRLYNPATGRFLSVDPVPGGNANAYDYVTGNPVNSTDLDGRRSYRTWWSYHWWGFVLHITATKDMTRTLHEDVQAGTIAGVLGELGICSRLGHWLPISLCFIVLSMSIYRIDDAINSAYLHKTCYETEVMFHWPAVIWRIDFTTRHGRHCKES